jgi:hypothetical protein
MLESAVPSLGPKAPVIDRVFLACTGARLQLSGYGRGPGELSGSPEGWPSTSIPSLEERLDDHQPTRAWEHREEPSRKG